MTLDDLRAEAEECRKSAVGNGEYNVAFHVAHIVLSSLANRLEARLTNAASSEAHAAQVGQQPREESLNPGEPDAG